MLCRAAALCCGLLVAAALKTSDVDLDSPEASVMLLQHSVDALGTGKIFIDTGLLETRQEEKAGQNVSQPQNSETCLTKDVQAILSGLKDTDQTLSWGVGLPAVALFFISAVVLLLGHKLVAPVVLTTSAFAGFYFTFELLKAAFPASCAVPVWGAVLMGVVAAAAAFFFLELAIIIPGALFGTVLAYQAQVFLTSVSPHLRNAPIMVKYYWCVALLSALVFAFIAHKLREDIFILITSALGAFGVTIATRGLLLDYAHVHMSDISEFIVMVATFILGMVYQHRSYKQSKWSVPDDDSDDGVDEALHRK
eukprot:CAMPEP_0181406882 /NCGR_PEP_ID=MMETSP1110-20121109/5497_1 /TAXON_ID=174948 /ORGANISM="Symbiodinium sp., Strain CCMP421" /LENGTH=308 /DNA_ID=CAMNT_0023529301 /DNA_START=311 /DNA_END=1237 /DNA_ORIENTATION=-